jgi:hypothetical protein
MVKLKSLPKKIDQSVLKELREMEVVLPTDTLDTTIIIDLEAIQIR